jgi:hypothetical protein
VSLQRGPGAFDLTDPAAGLAELSRYEAVLKLTFDGTRDAQPYHLEKAYVLNVDRSLPAAFLTETSLGSDGTRTESLTGLLGEIRYSQNAPDQACQAAAAAEDGMSFTPALLLPPLLGGEAAGEEVVDGFQTRVYSFDQQAIGAGEAAVASGRVWIAEPGGQVIKYTLTLDSDTVFGTGIQGRQFWEYTLRDPGAGAVQLPASCPPPLTDIPVPTDASALTQMPAEIRYQTALDKNALAAFYADQLAPLGYQPQGEGIETARGTQWVHVRSSVEGRDLLIITAAPVDGGLKVWVVRLAMKP